MPASSRSELRATNVRVRKRKEAKRRKTHSQCRNLPAAARAWIGRARLSALHRGARLRDVGPFSSGPGQASWDVVSAGVTRRRLSQSSESTPHAGPNAGGHDARTRPGAAVTNRRPQAPASRSDPPVSPADRPLGERERRGVSQNNKAKSKHFDLFKQIGQLRGANFCCACSDRARLAFNDSLCGNYASESVCMTRS